MILHTEPTLLSFGRGLQEVGYWAKYEDGDPWLNPDMKKWPRKNLCAEVKRLRKIVHDMNHQMHMLDLDIKSKAEQCTGCGAYPKLTSTVMEG